ncbi:retrovirus-related pol polyprotein from transposon TNT 1-94 [Tanacetum coccineum]
MQLSDNSFEHDQAIWKQATWKETHLENLIVVLNGDHRNRNLLWGKSCFGIWTLAARKNMTGNRSKLRNLWKVLEQSDSGMIIGAIMGLEFMYESSPICLLSKASKSKSWLWHRRLNHLNFGTINDLARKDLVRGLPRLKFEKDHLCSACQLGKSKKFSHRPKSENTNMEVLHTLHMDLCGPMRVQSIKGKKYILVIVDDYSRFTWVKFLRSKDETPEFVTNFLKQIQNTMAEQNVPAQPPTRTDEQIVPRSQWLTIGKSNLLFNAQKIQKNPIFQISVDILSNTNHSLPQQFCQLDEQWFDLSADLLRRISDYAVNPAHPFELPPSGDTVIDFVNELGYPEPVEIERLLAVTTRHPVLQMLWGIFHSKPNVDHAELYWEEFTQGIQDIFLHKEATRSQKLESESLISNLYDEEDEASQDLFLQRGSDDPDLSWLRTFLPHGRAPVGGVSIRDPVSEATPKLHEVVGKGKAVVTEEQDDCHRMLIPDKSFWFFVFHRIISMTLSTIGDQFLHDKTNNDDQEKLKFREVARLEQEMSEVKKTDHSADVLASIRSQVPTAVDNYLLKVLERHTADLIEKYFVLPGPESVKNQRIRKT